eukprot:366472-Chlamydomonas_euryale.AAC.12
MDAPTGDTTHACLPSPSLQARRRTLASPAPAYRRDDARSPPQPQPTGDTTHARLPSPSLQAIRRTLASPAPRLPHLPFPSPASDALGPFPPCSSPFNPPCFGLGPAAPIPSPHLPLWLHTYETSVSNAKTTCAGVANSSCFDSE